MSRSKVQRDKNLQELLSLLRLIEGNLITAANEIFRLSGCKFGEAWRVTEEAIDRVHAAYHFMSSR